jgi:hypothetical protein
MTTPQLTAVVVTPGDFAQIRRTVHTLRDQDIADAIELVVVAPSEAAVADRTAPDVAGFAAVRVVEEGPIRDVDRAAAAGILAASADVVAIIEDHAYVHAGWARAILDAYASGPWVSVGSIMRNANPRTGLSWCNLLLGYGWWLDPQRAGEMHDVPSHNGSYRREAVLALDGPLVERMGRAGDLHDALRAAGGRMYLCPEAEISHANPSRVPPTADLRFNAGRLYGAERAAGEGWSTAKRLAYALLWLLIPLVRLRGMAGEAFGAGRPLGEVRRRALPATVLALYLDAAGQAVGYLTGAGGSLAKLCTFEMDRVQHLCGADRRMLAPPPPPTAGR